MKQRFRSGGLAAWSIRRPISVVMLSLTVVVLGFFSLDRLGIDLLPHIIYPEVRIRIIDTGVPTKIMEDQVTRQLEEQLAITEGAIAVQSRTSEGESRVDISFPYGTDIDLALRDASTRLDRAKRFLPTTIDPPVIYKRDPSQIPVLELAVSSNKMDPVQLREWVDYDFSRWFINLPGVAAAEVGGGNVREIQIVLDQERLASLNLTLSDLIDIIRRENLEVAGGRLLSENRELSTRAIGRFQSIEAIRQLPLTRANEIDKTTVRLGDVAKVFDSHEDERLRVRLNGDSAIKLSIQKQPQANTVAVVDVVKDRLAWLKQAGLLPADVSIASVSDQSVFVRHALRNASSAAISGALLAMFVVYMFLGNLRRTLIIGTAIPLAILVTFALMAMAKLTLNIMTLGGLALGIGMLIDSTIIMLENITRHQRQGEKPFDAAVNAATEINSAIVASTTTNLAAILPFLFISGLVGLLFNELIYTLSASITASLIVAITLVPSLGSRVVDQKSSTPCFAERLQGKIEYLVAWLGDRLAHSLQQALTRPYLVIGVFLIALLLPVQYFFFQGKQKFLPNVDEGQVSLSIDADSGVQFDELDNTLRQVEKLVREQPEVDTIFAVAGGRIFGRSEYYASNVGTIDIQLFQGVSSEQWIKKMRKLTDKMKLAGYKFRLWQKGVRGIRISSGDDDISVRVQGPDLDTLSMIGDQLTDELQGIPGIRNLKQTYEELKEEVAIQINRERAADLGIPLADIGTALRVALQGQIVSEYLDNDRQFALRLRLPAGNFKTPTDLQTIIVGIYNKRPIRLGDVAYVHLTNSASTILRDNQRRIVEVSASLTEDADLGFINKTIWQRLENFKLPEGYNLYDGGATRTLQEGKSMGVVLLFIAIFLVFVVMAVQYESLTNPLIIIFSIPFTAIGVAIGMWLSGLRDWVTGITLNLGGKENLPLLSFAPYEALPISMPVWLGLIMLAGIVVNNAIVLVEQIEIEREKGRAITDAIIHSARLRLRPILMTSLTTVVGMLPLALGLGQGAEMLQPLALVITWGLSFSVLVSLFLVPACYRLVHS